MTNIRGINGLFKQYLKTGYYPLRASLTSDDEFYRALMASIEKVIFNDIASYYSLKTTTLNIFKKILYFVTSIPPGKINPNALWSIGRKQVLKTWKSVNIRAFTLDS